MVNTVGADLEARLTLSAEGGKLPCATALQIAKEAKVAPKDVGEAANKLNITIIDCQLGCFMYTGLEKEMTIEQVNPALKTELTASLTSHKLACAAAFKLARKLNLGRREVGKAADALGVKIGGCQLGCFP